MPKGVVHFFSKKYIAGELLDDAIRVTQELNAKGIMTTIDVLGESITSKEEAVESKEECLRVLDAIETYKLNSNLSIKPTQMGLMLDLDFAYQQVKELVVKAAAMNNFVRIDMEDSSTTDRTFELYKRLFATHRNVGVVLQSYLKRTYDDAAELNKMGTNYRFCKGIYVEPEKIAYKDRQEIRDNFLKVLELMLKNGNYVGIATHDTYLIDGSLEIINRLKVPREKYEFQMLLGVREDLRDKINADKHRLRIYIPYGKDWYKYSIRRLKENPNMAGNIVKAFFNIK